MLAIPHTVAPARRRLARPVFTIPLVFVLGLFVARLPARIAQVTGWGGGGGDFLAPVDDVHQMLDETYVTKPDDDALQRGAIDGMLEALNDPYALYVHPKERAEFEKEIAGHYVGIGANVQLEGGYLSIVSPMEDSPAAKAGILAGDRVLEIEGKSTLGLSIDECIKLLAGSKGEPVRLTVQRDGKPLPVTVMREEIHVRAVKGFRRVENGESHWEYMIDPESRIAYVRLTQFIPTAFDELARAMEELGADKEGGIGGLILDLRDNPGGDLDVCLDIADLFLPDGVIVSVKGRTGEEEVFTAEPAGTLPAFPMMVLVNGQSASASEILAGALSEHNRAVVLGSRSFGKGLVQTVRDVPHGGGQVKFTAQRYYLPSGRLLQREDESLTWGVDPTPGFYIPMTPEEELGAFLKRRDLDVVRKPDQAAQEKWNDPEWIASQFDDKQLAAALTSLRARVATGDWKPINEATQQVAKINAAEKQRLERAEKGLSRELARVERRLERMEAASEGSGPRSMTELDLWPDSLDLTNGHIRVLDKDGTLVASLLITGRDVERWVASADVKPEKEPNGEGADKTDANAAPKDQPPAKKD